MQTPLRIFVFLFICHLGLLNWDLFISKLWKHRSAVSELPTARLRAETFPWLAMQCHSQTSPISNLETLGMQTWLFLPSHFCCWTESPRRRILQYTCAEGWTWNLVTFRIKALFPFLWDTSEWNIFSACDVNLTSSLFSLTENRSTTRLSCLFL